MESAVFNGSSIRRTSNRLNLRSESSVRYERGVDLNRTKLALDYACYLFKELCEKVGLAILASKASTDEEAMNAELNGEKVLFLHQNQVEYHIYHIKINLL